MKHIETMTGIFFAIVLTFMFLAIISYSAKLGIDKRIGEEVEVIQIESNPTVGETVKVKN